MLRYFIFTLIIAFSYQNEQNVTDPIITSWIKTTGIDADFNCHNNVYRISYSSGYMYIYCNSIPSYKVGPWAENPNDAVCQDYIFKIPRTVKVPATQSEVDLGAIGIFTNGVLIYNADDGKTYNNAGIWKRNAYVWEKVSFDSCVGHPDAKERYHMHINPTCLYDSKNSTVHSPIIGYIFDGSPVYGSYGYSDPNDASSSLTRMTTSWQKNNNLVSSGRTNGPAVDSTYPLGSFINDFTFQRGSGTLDEFNGRQCVTPEYPNGIYAYFATTDANNVPTFPFIVGPKYHGKAFDQGEGVNYPNELVTVYYSLGRRFTSEMFLILFAIFFTFCNK